MLRRVDALRLDQGTVVCGCGGGAAVAAVLWTDIARITATDVIPQP